MDAHPDPGVDGVTARFDRRELHDLLCGLSGELCRPLASLRMGFDLLLGGTPPVFSAAQVGHVSAMRGLCDDLLRLARGYLEYAEVLRASRPLSLGSYSLGALAAEVDRAFAASAREKGLGWSVEVADADALLTTDVSRCQLILVALVSNAIKFTPPGGRVRVVGEVDDDSWKVSVVDDGPGMTQEEAARAFEPFYRLTRDEHAVEGSGLGLPIARELASQIGGRIELTASEGEGVVAVAIFPRVAGPAPPPTTPDRH
ncbi:HAMP domain-containing sensor histidine kinase [Paludisphaera sp.]|uniref:sensor histidine kinase n=1 Tax=Paludisphaera sp. TaxID=2017432 RepID=UPI00301D7584